MFGRHFSGVHMVWGAINEMTTLQGYRRLWKLAGHPVLEQLLRAIAQEEQFTLIFTGRKPGFAWKVLTLRGNYQDSW